MGFTAKHQDGTSYWHADTVGDGLDTTCGGTGMVNCHCGGDLCVCGNFGEAECPGCVDCDRFDDHDYDCEGQEYPDDD